MAFLVGKGGLFGPSSDLTYVADAQKILAEVGRTGVHVPSLIKSCTALVFVKTVKAAFWGKVEAGYGVVIAKKDTPQGPMWTAPCAINQFGAGGGFSWGVSKFETMYVINAPNPAAVFQAMQAQAGAEVDLKVGKGQPLGQLKFGDYNVQCVSVSTGIMLDVSLAGTYLAVDNESNMQIYGRPVSAEQLLQGEVPPPPQFKPLADTLYHLAAQAP